MTGQVIDLSKFRPGRHRAHRADKYAHPAYRKVAVYFEARVVDEYRPKHLGPGLHITSPGRHV